MCLKLLARNRELGRMEANLAKCFALSKKSEKNQLVKSALFLALLFHCLQGGLLTGLHIVEHIFIPHDLFYLTPINLGSLLKLP